MSQDYGSFSNKEQIDGTGGNSVWLSGGERIESVIGPNTEILIEIQNVSGQTKDIGLIVEGYEA